MDELIITNRVPADLVKYKTPAQNWNGVLAETITMNAFISSYTSTYYRQQRTKALLVKSWFKDKTLYS